MYKYNYDIVCWRKRTKPEREYTYIAYYITKEVATTVVGTPESEIEYDYSSRYYIEKELE